MPVVPINQNRPNIPVTSLGPVPDKNYELMAAAQMHSEGRLIKVAESATGLSKDWQDSWEKTAPNTPEGKSSIPKDWETFETKSSIYARPQNPSDLTS